MNNLNILIVGQGLAGSLLAWMLLKRNIPVTVVDQKSEKTASKVAAGIMIPVTGRRLAKTYLADTLVPFAIKTYGEMEKDTASLFWNQKDVLQIFSSLSNLNEWYARSSEPGMEQYCGTILKREKIHSSVKNEFGGILLKQCGYVDTGIFLEAMNLYIRQKGTFKESEFDYDDLKIKEGAIEWAGQNYTHLIFCEGYRSIYNPYFNYLPFKPAKGEILDFSSPELNGDYIISTGSYILPMGNGNFRIGATYVWDDLTEQTTTAGYDFLVSQLKSSINCEFEILNQQVGIRPAIRDRRPLVGYHPSYPQIGIFNGLGTKGAMLGPYYAKQMADLIQQEIAPDRDVNIRRFDSLFQET